MISLKIKTLDSQDHDFTVDEEITVRQFKEHIATNTGVNPDNQRLIYCGRVLNDAKLLKEYGVNGKVVHLVEGAPPRVRNVESRAADANSSTTNNRRTRDSNEGGRAPIFRTIDGMVLGAMAIPMNGNGENAQTNSEIGNPFSTLCLNRIIVARHMLECVNNIINYLENPEVGLNNNEMDVLAQRTMESTVFEVGISAVGEVSVEVPQQQVQNFVQAFQGAVSAAFRQSGLTNIEVSQPTDNGASGSTSASRTYVVGRTPFVLDHSNTSASATTAADQQASSSNSSGISIGSTVPVVTPTPPPPPPPSEEVRDTPTVSSQPTRNSRYQTTSTRVLAEVVEQMKTVQERFEPFLRQYYEILQNDPTFAENETTARENAQRIFDRVSEGLHYMAHAQHAISDLMLDLSMSTPRHLCCRPILVEQSAFVSSGFAVPNIVVADRGPNNNNNETATANNNAANATVNQPINQPVNVAPAPTQSSTASQVNVAQPSTGGVASNLATANGRPLDTNRQLQVARLIQAVVNSVPMYTDVHVEFSRRNGGDQTTQTSTTSTANNNATTNESSTTTNESGQPRVTTATHPTTSTQTRSTARPQVHVTGLPTGQMRNLRPVSVPSMQVSSFDRFLPCNSHHVRDNQERNNTAHQLLVHRPQRNRRLATTAPAPPQEQPNVPDDPLASLTSDEYSTPVRLFGSELRIRDLVNVAPIPSSLNRIRSDLYAYIVGLFGSPPVQAKMVIIYQKIYDILNRSVIAGNATENPSYDALNSVNNLIQHTLPNLVNLVLEDDSADFGMRLFRTLIEFVRRLLVILVLCVGRKNAQQFINEMTDIGISPLNESENAAIVAFKRYIRAAASRQFDTQSLDTSDVNEFLVIRLPQTEDNTATTSNGTPMETDEETSTRSIPTNPAETIDKKIMPLTPPVLPPARNIHNQEPLPSIVVGSASWHNGLPTTWLPVITQDIGRQRRATTQGPFSDAYISGMSSKRRKLITSTKPSSADPNSILRDGIRHVIQSRNPLPAVPIDDVFNLNPQLQEPHGSYEQALRNHVQSRINRDPDYSAERFPNCSKWLNKKK